MTWNQLLQSHRAQRHTTSRQELDGLRSVVARDLTDAALADLSTDRAFAIAYNAALQLATLAIACAGYRIVGSGHHRTTFPALRLAIGPEAFDFGRYFDLCRRKRNIIDYDLASTASEVETIELIEKVGEIHLLVERWITRNFPDYSD